MKKEMVKEFMKKTAVALALTLALTAGAPGAEMVYAAEENTAEAAAAGQAGQEAMDPDEVPQPDEDETQSGEEEIQPGGEETQPDGEETQPDEEVPPTEDAEPDYYLDGNRLVDSVTGEAFEGTGFVPVGDTYYYVADGVWNKKLQGIIKVANVEEAKGEWWYVKGGMTDFTANTVAKNSKGWWKITDGRVDFAYTGIAKNSNGWWRCQDGKVNFKYTGFAENENGWWYCEKGKVKFNKTTVMKGKVEGRNGWWYVKKNQVMFTDTVAKNENGWWYIKNGRVDFGYDGFGQNKNGWWYCQDGQVSFRVNSVVKGTVNSTKAWWYVQGSKVVFTDTVAKNANGWWRIEDGKVNFDCNSVEKNENGWWKIKNGKVDFSFTGIAKNAKGWWYCKGGKVQFGATAVVKGTVDGTNAWWYINKGKVDKSYNGLGSNSNGTWLIEDGKVNFSFSGKKTIDGVQYTFVEGRCTSLYRGWKKLGGKYYYFDRQTGVQMKNCTVDGIKLQSDGSAVSSAYNNEKIRTMIKARSIMESITKTSDSKEAKLKKCFNWVMKKPYKRYRTLVVARRNSGWEMLFANDHFERGNGCCVSDACAFAFLAKECGYKTVYVCDDTGHAWAEIDGFVYDPLFAEAKNYNNNYKAPYGVYILHPVNKTKI